MTWTEFEKNVRLLYKKLLSSEPQAFKLNKSDKEILLNSFYFACRFRSLKHSYKEMRDREWRAEKCFHDRGSNNYKNKKAISEAAKIMGWTDGKVGKKTTRHPVKEERIIAHFRGLKDFEKLTNKEAVEQTFKDLNLDVIADDSKMQFIKRLRKKYPEEHTEEELEAMAPDWDFEDLDVEIDELIVD